MEMEKQSDLPGPWPVMTTQVPCLAASLAVCFWCSGVRSNRSPKRSWSVPPARRLNIRVVARTHPTSRVGQKRPDSQAATICSRMGAADICMKEQATEEYWPTRDSQCETTSIFSTAHGRMEGLALTGTSAAGWWTEQVGQRRPFNSGVKALPATLRTGGYQPAVTTKPDRRLRGNRVARPGGWTGERTPAVALYYRARSTAILLISARR